MAIEIHKARVRDTLAPRAEPYWAPPIAAGRYLGLRRLQFDESRWIARARNEETGGQKYKALGQLTAQFGYDQALAAAQAWFKDLDAGLVPDGAPLTVEGACKRYVEHLEREKGKASARDAERRFERYVYETAFGRSRVDRIRTAHIMAWRDGMKIGARLKEHTGDGKAAKNRHLTSLKAALSLAVRERQVSSERAREWADVKAYKDAGKRRDLYLDLAQRRALLEAATGGIRDLLEAAALTGCRAGELVNATRASFDERTSTLIVSGKTGRRAVPLSPAAVALFTRLAKSKLPAAPLLTRDDGKRWAHSDWDDLVRAAAEAAKLPKGVCLYTLRHSWITSQLLGSMSTLEVAKIAGTSLAMIEKHYGHLVQGAARELLAKVVML